MVWTRRSLGCTADRTVHLPAPQLGLKTIAVITSNDRYVNEAWRKSIEDRMQAKMALTMLSDADGAALRALGLVDDLGFGMGERANRFAVLAEDGKVRCLLPHHGPSPQPKPDRPNPDPNPNPNTPPN